MALDHRTKVFGVREARVVKLLTDNAGSAATYSGVSSLVVASPTPTATTFSVTAADGSKFTVGRAIGVGTGVGVIASIATDAITLTAALAGGAPTAGTAVTMTSGFPLTGMKSLAVTTTMKTTDLRGDNTFLDTDSVLQALQFEVDTAKVSFDVIALMLGGTVTDTGTTPSQQTVWNLLTQPLFGYFKIEARCFTVDQLAGDLHIVASKVKAADAPLFGFAEEDYHYPKIKCKAVPPVGTTPWVSAVLNETALPIL